MARWKVNRGRLGLPPAWLIIAALCGSASSLSAQDLPLKREIPGSGPYQCPPEQKADKPGAEEQMLARQLASTAAQAVILGDLDRARSVLARATQLDPSSADLAYRHARVLQDLNQAPAAIAEYCRALAADSLAEGIGDARQRIQALAAATRTKLPAQAVTAFQEGLKEADAGRLERAAMLFDTATVGAPEWPEAVFDRGVVAARLGRAPDATRDLRKYLELRPDAPDAIDVSRRIGELQSLSLVSTPSPSAALFLGMVVPGMGQFYSGRALGGMTVLSLAAGAVAAGYLVKKVDVLCLSEPGSDGTCPADQVVKEKTNRPYLTAAVGAAAAVTVVGAVTAFLGARGRRNARTAAGSDDATTTRAPRLAMPTVAARGTNVDFALLRVTFR
jgi:tetratricopeptide (TPR) repeat protein